MAQYQLLISNSLRQEINYYALRGYL